MFSRSSFIVLVLTSVFSFPVLSEEAPLDPPYKKPKEFWQQAFTPKVFANVTPKPLPVRNDVPALIAKQTPVKAQLSRGTCSIFSATALLESMLIIDGHFTTADLSEEWLEYLIMRETGAEGSSSSSNFYALERNGAVEESVLPYIGEDWTKAPTSLSDGRCGKVPTHIQTHCLLAHRDPRLLEKGEDDLHDQTGEFYDYDFSVALINAAWFRHIFLQNTDSSHYVWGQSEVKKLLNKGIPLTMDIDFYYGAWNHRLAPNFSIPRNLEHWNLGIVGYPEHGSVDRKNSLIERAGHSVVIVGYDDEKEVTVTQLMEDGTEKEFTYTGVYYFKNSWGTAGFGIDMEIDSVNYPGYGMITQRYADEFGSFHKFILKK